jgi:TusA-related sulfurtransferase
MAKTVLDLKGLKYTMPIVKTSVAIKKGSPGDVFEVVSDYSGFEHDIRQWCEETGNVLDTITQSGEEITATITKKK